MDLVGVNMKMVFFQIFYQQLVIILLFMLTEMTNILMIDLKEKILKNKEIFLEKNKLYGILTQELLDFL